MDPNATLKKIYEFLAAGRTGDIVDIWCHDLYEWISRGGFEPDWKVYPLGESYYKSRRVSEPLTEEEMKGWFE